SKVNVWGGLSVLAPDALSSVAYGTQEILIELSAVGTAALWYSLPISLLIGTLLTFLIFSYRRLIEAYPGGGGAYVIGRDTLGTNVSLLAGAALLIDYTLTVAVSVTAGVEAIVSAFPSLAVWTVPLNILIIFFITMVNLRGVREAAKLFAFPTYLFILMVLGMVAIGLLTHSPHAPTLHQYIHPQISIGAVGILVLLRAYSSGSSALTGVEAISNGVPIFQDVAYKRAKMAELFLGLFLGSMFLGTSIIAFKFHVIPNNQVTVLQQLANDLFGKGLYFYVLSFVTMAILAVAANTSFTGFPQLASIMARDKWMPRMFLSRGDRLVYQNGIIVLSIIASLLIIIFNGNTNSLIPLYAIGVYISFTITQTSLIKRYLTEKDNPLFQKHLSSVPLIAIGAMLTALVVVISIISKFMEGAWIVVIAIPLIILSMHRIRRHYNAIAKELRFTDFSIKPQKRPLTVIVPVASVNRMLVSTLSYAVSISDNVIALNVAQTPEQEQALQAKWNAWHPDDHIKLVVLQTQFRSIIRPILRYIEHFSNQDKERRIMVLIPEFVVGRTWENFL
ncbi:MAG: APC family permease, partial [Firmicutes bacterium]|nr:APC family permease [Bacillota bacterium]